ncbi:hypothetical protein [Rhizobium rhizogenes]|uniref:hypothetical protein n=1 Tax=Rhizobium rhizogenes TaxID=359 RepID=UPI0015721804|nr:hypothetical protein [Rhizobium rhizogenes]NTG97126.1 hypothetical protein [Rhizobium rhizogenes]
MVSASFGISLRIGRDLDAHGLDEADELQELRLGESQARLHGRHGKVLRLNAAAASRRVTR